MTIISEHPVLDIVSDRNAFAAHQERNLSATVVEDIQRKITEAGVEYIYYMLPHHRLTRHRENGSCQPLQAQP